ncbi:MAG: DUF5050 domain-containing protein [Acidobacteriota bacterium]
MRNGYTLAFVAAIMIGLVVGCSQTAKSPDWTKAAILADNLDHPNALTADEKNIYFVTGGTIASLNEGTSGVWKMPISGGAPVQLFRGYKKDEKTVVLPDAFVMATDGKYVYFSTGYIYRVPKDGGEAQQITSGSPTEMAIDNERVYWHNFVGEGMRSTPAYSADKNGGEAKPLTGAVNISAIAIDGEFLYWAQPDGIYKTLKSGGEPVKVYAAPEKIDISGLALDGDDLYFTSGTGRNALMRVSIKGGEAAKVADEINHTFPIYAEGGNIYFIKNEGTFGTSLNFISKSGGQPAKLDSGYLAGYFVKNGHIFIADIARIYDLAANTN